MIPLQVQACETILKMKFVVLHYSTQEIWRKFCGKVTQRMFAMIFAKDSSGIPSNADGNETYSRAVNKNRRRLLSAAGVFLMEKCDR